MSGRADTEAVFVGREMAARRCCVSVDTFDLWVKDGFVPGPAITRGQIRRWHWPSIEATLMAKDGDREADPYMTGVRHRA